MGAGGEPVGAPPGHPPRPPIPIAAVDLPAAQAARERLRAAGLDHLAELAAWLAAVSGERPLRARLLVTRDDLVAGVLARALRADVVRADPGVAPAGPAMTVGEVAHAVDAGRDLAAGAAQDGVTVLATAAPDDPGAARVAEALVTGDTGPLRALRRLGGPDTAVLCGVALGAGERGLGLLAAGAVALAAAAVAAGVEPDLGRRVLAAADDPLAGHLDLPVALGARGMGPLEAAAGALAVLRLADAARR